jgi:hypothetical protein
MISLSSLSPCALLEKAGACDCRHRGLIPLAAVAPQTGTLDVHRCRLVTLPPELVRLAGPSITAVDLTGNGLTALPAADLSALRHTRELRVGGNRLAALPESIRSLTGLTGLFAPDNRLTALPATLAWLSVLTALDLDGNRHCPPLLPQSCWAHGWPPHLSHMVDVPDTPFVYCEAGRGGGFGSSKKRDKLSSSRQRCIRPEARALSGAAGSRRFRRWFAARRRSRS